MASKEELVAYKHAEVAKIFPLYGTEPFKGTVKAVDTTGKDNAPFRIVYEDGDSEWITLQELKSILVKDSSKQRAPKSDKKRARSQKQTSEAPRSATDDAAAAVAAAADQHQEHKKQKKHKHSTTSSQQQQKQQAAPAAAAAGADAAKEAAKAAKAAAKKAPAAAEAAGEPAAAGQGGEGLNAERAKRQLKAQQQGLPGVISFTISAGAARAAAEKTAAGSSKDAAASGKGEAAGKPSKAAATNPTPAAAAAAAPTGTPGRKGAGKGAAGAGDASMSTADTQGMLAAIHQAAAPTADKLGHDRRVARMPYQGPGAAVLPAMSQVVVTGGHCYITLHSAPRPRHSTTPGKVANLQQQQQQQPSTSAGHFGEVDYEAESAALLGELQRLLKHSGTDQRWLIKVRVTLHSMQEGLPGFQAAWNAWVKRDELPVMTLVEGAGPFKAAGVMLEATALVNA